jgi:hypothetical protein
VPLRLKGKNGKDPSVMGTGWTKRTLTDDIPNFDEGDNIGFLLGKPSGNVVRGDPDFQAIKEVTDILFPEQTAVFGRKSSPRSGRLYTCDIKTTNFKLPSTMKGDPRLPIHEGKPSVTVFQILSTGAQTMAPPSVHENGEEIAWVNTEKPLALERDELIRRVGIEAFCMAVRQFWPPYGFRNEAAMALARVLLETFATSIADDEQRIAIVDEMVLAVAMDGGDGEKSRNGKERASATLEKMKAGEHAIGLPSLIELLDLPKTVEKTFRKWLGLARASSSAVLFAAGALNWRECRANGMPLPTMHNARLAIAALGVECSYDVFHSKMLFGFRGDDVRHELKSIIGEVTDDGIIRLRQLMSDRFGVDLEDKATRDAVKSMALDHCFDPVCDMLDKAEAEWDGTKRLDSMAVTYFNCEDTELNRAIFRKTMIAAVKRARVPGCKFDNILTLESPEGHLKSSAFNILAGDDNFSDESILGKSSREVQEQLSGVWIHENADLAGMRKAEVEHVKAFASRQVDIARPAYGHFPKRQKRRSIEVATTNSVEYLQSPTGNRRFWTVTVLKMIDVGPLRRDRLQLWGEAARCQSSGESLLLDEKLWPLASEEQESRRVKDSWEDKLADIPEYVPFPSDDGKTQRDIQIVYREDGLEKVKSADLLAYVLRIPIGQQKKADSMRLSDAMRHVGWERTGNKITVKGKQVRGYSRSQR